MSKNTLVKSLVGRAAIVASVAALGYAGYVFAFGLPASATAKPSLDESMAKLAKIGRALQIYREEYGVKPVAERRHWSDAGLPRGVSVLSLHPNRLWYVPKEDVQLWYARAPGDYHFRQLYFSPADMRADTPLPDITPVWSERGEQMPILQDYYFVSEAQWRAGGTVRVPILRLNGDVDLVDVPADDGHMFRVWEK